MKAIAFVTRVHPERPRKLKVCIDSVKAQTDNDYIHIIHRDDKTKNGYGLFSANRSFTKVSPIDARYVMVLDDDDILTDLNFVKKFKRITNKDNSEIVFFKGYITGKGTYPKQQFWKKAPQRRYIASFCFAVRLDIWKKYIHKWGKESCGDFFFISECYRKTKKYSWLNCLVVRTQGRPGKGEGETKT